MAENHVNRAELRVEDDALVRGAGRFVADSKPADAAIAMFVRSPHAHARVASIDVEAARGVEGVLAVLTAEDVKDLGNVARHPPMTNRNGMAFINPKRPVLAGEIVRHVGEPVAAVVAVNTLAAQEAVDLVNVEYEILDPVVAVADALGEGAAQVHDEAPKNLAFDWTIGTAPDAVDAIFKDAAKVARLTLANQRIMCATMEPRGATGFYDAATDRYTLIVCSQGAGPMRDQMAAILGVDKAKVHVISEEVGGAFGMKTGAYPEYPLVMVAARTLGRPVHWMSTRSEAMQSDNQARDAVTEAELALDDNGKFLALRVRHLVAMGAYLTNASGNLATSNFGRCFPTVYDIPKIDVAVQCVFTHTTPTGAYRGAGRPEANYVMERLVDEAARLTGIDRVRLRKRNLIRASKMPYKTAVGTTFDSGDFPAVFDKALQLAEVEGFKARARDSRKRGLLRGLGLSCFLEHAGGTPTEGASISFPGGEQIVLGIGVQSTGQGHATVYPHIVAERLGIPADQIRHRHGDSDLNIVGAPSVASRSTITAGSAIVNTCDLVIAKGKAVAAALLEASEADIGYEHGRFAVVGTDRGVSLFEVAARSKELAAAGRIAEPLDTNASRDTPQTFPNGCHIAEVEIDPESGDLKVVRYAAVDDCGRILNHTLVEGQIHGSMVQGLGQVIGEHTAYDESGQLITGSFMDYLMPRADDVPPILTGDHTTLATTNPLGVKGVGEAGTTAALAAIMNAVADAVPNGAADHMDMPATREKLWQACQTANVSAA